MGRTNEWKREKPEIVRRSIQIVLQSYYYYCFIVIWLVCYRIRNKKKTYTHRHRHRYTDVYQFSHSRGLQTIATTVRASKRIIDCCMVRLYCYICCCYCECVFSFVSLISVRLCIENVFARPRASTFYNVQCVFVRMIGSVVAVWKFHRNQSESPTTMKIIIIIIVW